MQRSLHPLVNDGKLALLYFFRIVNLTDSVVWSCYCFPSSDDNRHVKELSDLFNISGPEHGLNE